MMAEALTEMSSECDNSVLESMEDTGAHCNPLEIPLIVSKMMKYLGTETLLTCRLVCHQYNIIATTILKKSRLANFKLNIQFSKKENCFIIERRQQNGKTFHDPLRKLNELLNSDKSPFIFFCTHFSICGGSLSNPDLRHFISLHGENIKRLELYFYARNDNEGLEMFRKLLLSKATNLTHLHLKCLPEWQGQLFDDMEKNSCAILMYMPSLKVLSIGKDVTNSTVVADLILMATNLQELYNCPTPYMCQKEPRLLEKMRLVKGLKFHPQEHDWALCCQLGILTSNLTCVDISLNELYTCLESWPRVTKTLNYIFQSSRSTLTNFGTEQLGFLAQFGLEMPSSFEKVTKLYLQFWMEKLGEIDDWSLLTNAPSLPQLFPNVEKLKFRVSFMDDLSEDDENCWNRYIPLLEPFPKVTRLTFRDPILDAKWLDKLSVMCPNVKNIKIGTFSVPKFSLLFSDIPKFFEHVEYLHLFPEDDDGNYDDHDNATLVTASMDSAMTGIPIDICVDMKNIPRNQWPLQINDECNLPSLLSLTNLKSLQMDFPEPVSGYEEMNLLFSNISGIKGFEEMKKRRPEFKIIFRASRCPVIVQMLSQILPYVDDVIWDN